MALMEFTPANGNCFFEERFSSGGSTVARNVLAPFDANLLTDFEDPILISPIKVRFNGQSW